MATGLRALTGSNGHHVQMESIMDISLTEANKNSVKLPSLDSDTLRARLYSHAPTQAGFPPDSRGILTFRRPTNTQTRVAAIPKEPLLEPLVNYYYRHVILDLFGSKLKLCTQH